jgi:hypothetical protein
MDWPWWAAELATTVTGLHSTRFPHVVYLKNMVYRVNRREKLLRRILEPVRHTNGPDVLCSVTHFIIKRVRICIYTEGDHFEHSLN